MRVAVMDHTPETQQAGLCLSEQPAGDVIEVRTRNRAYELLYLGNQNALVTSHAHGWGEPVAVKIQGSTWGGSMLKQDWIVPGMHLQFRLEDGGTLTTSRVVDVRRV